MAAPRIRARLAATFLFVATLVYGPLARAQETPPSSAQESFGERVDIEVVSVDVIVTDRNHGRVLDLGRDDFELLVDGRPVPIEYFAAPRRSVVPATPPTITAETLPSLAIAPVLPQVPTTSTNLIIFIDQTALENPDRQSALEGLREFLRSRPEGADRVTVASFEQRLNVLLPPTTDRELIAGALDKVEERPSLASLGSRERKQLEREIRELATFPRDPRGLEQEIESWAEQQLDRESRSVAALGQLVQSLAAVEGRKEVALVTAGIESEPAQFLLAALDQQRGAASTAETNRSPTLQVRGQALLAEFEEMIRAAQNARVAFYAVSPAFRPPAENGAEFRGSGPGSARALPRDFGPAEASASLARLAGATGGDRFTIGRDLGSRLAEVTADSDAAYSLGFSTDPEAGESDHRIEVRTRRTELTVRHRESYRRRPAPERAEAALTAATTFGQTENPLEITLSLGAGKSGTGKKPTQLVPITVGIPLRLISLLPEGGGRRGSLSVQVSIQDARGHRTESGVTMVPISIPEGDVERALAASWYHRAELSLSPGPQRIAVAVVDQISGVQSTVFEELDVSATK